MQAGRECCKCMGTRLLWDYIMCQFRQPERGLPANWRAGTGHACGSGDRSVGRVCDRRWVLCPDRWASAQLGDPMSLRWSRASCCCSVGRRQSSLSLLQRMYTPSVATLCLVVWGRTSPQPGAQSVREQGLEGCCARAGLPVWAYNSDVGQRQCLQATVA